MIENKEFFLYFVGATIGRPLDLPEFSGGRPMVAPTLNNSSNLRYFMD